MDPLEPAAFVFVLGTGRCGSTVVQELLARHSAVGFVSNVDSILAPFDVEGRWNNIYRHVPSALASRDVAYLRHLRFTLRRTDAYRRDLSPEQIALLDEALRESLEALGYPLDETTAGDTPSLADAAPRSFHRRTLSDKAIQRGTGGRPSIVRASSFGGACAH